MQGAAPTLRVLPFTALAVLTAARWGGQVQPVTPALPRCALVAIALVVALGAAGRLGGRRRGVARMGAVALAVAAVVLACGVPLHALRPHGWDDLAGDLGHGIGALPGLAMPYRGDDAWIRTVIDLGGGLLLVAAAVLTALGGARGRAAATGVLCVLYAIPAITVVSQPHPFLDGALFTVLLAVFALGDGTARPRARLPAAAAVGTALLVALLLAPRLDGPLPVLNFQQLGARGADVLPDQFDWDHHYTSLHWPRVGRELLRVRAPAPMYWKGVTLDDFDGRRWRHVAAPPLAQADTELASGHPAWRATVQVSARQLRSVQAYAPGEVLKVLQTTVPVALSATGTLATTGRPLGPGDSYVARVYAPAPTPAQMARAGTRYPAFTARDLPVDAPVADYARTWALARRLKASASSPYDLVRRVQQRVQAGAVYDETPPDARIPLEDFLFGARRGYCQQFSGAMALLLRMAGVPARVAAGFAPGRRDPPGGYVVTDLDAHSWVEVYFPRIGWVVFDPTPAAAPPSVQLRLPGLPYGAGARAVAQPGGLSRDRPALPPGSAVPSGGSAPWAMLVLASVGIWGLALAARSWRTRRVRARAQRLAAGPELWELLRALAVTGRAVTPATTLGDLAARYRTHPGMVGYLDAVARQRYGAGPGPGPEDRRALRAALAEGLGVAGRLRAWWALPPVRLPEVR